MKKNGFTLIELIGVLVILAVIFSLTFPAVNSIIKSGKKTVYQSQINTILTATYDFSLKNPKFLPNAGDKVYIALAQLRSEGYVDIALINPNTNLRFNDDLVISIENVGADYDNSLTFAKLSGDYLYTIEFDHNSIANSKPTINFEGFTLDENLNYTTTLEINSEYEDINVTALSKDGDDLSSDIIKNIMYEDHSISKVNTDKLGIYYIYYTVIDKSGYSTTAVRSVAIVDNSAPTLSFSNLVIDQSINEYDLLSDVTCNDNSLVCNINYTGDVDYGVIGNYIIEYTAKDSSGNTKVQKRTVTIKER